MGTQRDLLQVHLFGGFSLTYDGEQLPPLASRHARLLLAWLVLQRGRPQPRSLLCDRFWPDVPEPRARRRLSHALWQVQDAFGESGQQQPYLLTPGDQVQFDATAPYWLDVEEFEQRLDEVDRAEPGEATSLRHLRRCMELYQGDLLAGFYEDWVLQEQERLRQRHVTGLARLVETAKQRSNYEEALVVARRWTHQAPLQEEAHRETMRLLVLLGRPSEALEQFERCRSVLEDELGSQPDAGTIALHDQIVRSRATDAPRQDPVAQLATDRLVGRDDERLLLVDQLERTLAGNAGTVFLEGEPGVGKTQLLAQMVDDARWRGLTVLWGACTGPDVPYAALRDAVAPELDPVRVAQLRAIVAPVWLREAGRLLPGLDDGAAPTDRNDLAGSAAAERMRQACTEVLVGLASIDPVVVVLEDLHQADPETLAVLRTLARHADPGRLLVVASFRDVDARQDPAVWSALRELDRDARPVHLRLEPMTPFETGGLLREVLGVSQLPASFVEAVHRECGGNPLYVLELLRSLRDTGALGSGVDHLDSLSVPVTSDLRSLIGSRIALLGWEAATVAEFAAVLDDQVAVETIQAGIGLGPRQVVQALGELARRNLVRADGNHWRFTHAATRRVLVDELDHDRAQQLHTAAADALEATRPEAVEALAAHLRAAGLLRRALPHLRAAAERAVALHAHETAAHHLEGALEALEVVPLPVGERADVLLRAEEVLDVLGRREQQDAVLRQLEELATATPDLATEVAIRRATHLGLVDRLDEGLAVARDAVEHATDDGRRGRALACEGELLHWQGHHERATEPLRRALAILPADGADADRARYALATALRAQQRFEEARALLEAAREAAEQRQDELDVVLALGGLADIAAETGRTDLAVDRYDRAIALAREIGYRHREGVGLVNLATVRLSRGEPAPALSAYDEAERVFRGLGNRRGVAIARLNRAWLEHRWLGLDDDATRDATAALEYSDEVGSVGLTASARETLAAVARRRGDLQEAERHLQAGIEAAAGAGDQRAEVQLRRGRIEVALEEGDAEPAAREAEAAADQALGLGLLEFVADLAALAAVGWLDAEQPDRARRALLLAAEHLDTCGERHRVHHRLAVVHDAIGEPAAGRGHHQAAVATMTEALAALPDDLRAAARQVPTHVAIRGAAIEHTPRTVDLRMARDDAPRGRELREGETRLVGLRLGPPARSPDERRSQLLEVLHQVDDQHASATVEDLSLLFDVSESTIRRDLRTLRQQGHEATTRGSETA